LGATEEAIAEKLCEISDITDNAIPGDESVHAPSQMDNSVLYDEDDIDGPSFKLNQPIDNENS